MKDQAARLLDQIDRLDGDTQGWKREILSRKAHSSELTTHWVSRAVRVKSSVEATHTEIKALAFELAMLIPTAPATETVPPEVEAEGAVSPPEPCVPLSEATPSAWLISPVTC